MKFHGNFKQQQMARKANHDRVTKDKPCPDGLKGMTANKPDYQGEQKASSKKDILIHRENTYDTSPIYGGGKSRGPRSKENPGTTG